MKNFMYATQYVRLLCFICFILESTVTKISISKTITIFLKETIANIRLRVFEKLFIIQLGFFSNVENCLVEGMVEFLSRFYPVDWILSDCYIYLYIWSKKSMPNKLFALQFCFALNLNQGKPGRCSFPLQDSFSQTRQFKRHFAAIRKQKKNKRALDHPRSKLFSFLWRLTSQQSSRHTGSPE